MRAAGHRPARSAGPRRASPAAARILRVAELIDADIQTVRALAGTLPASVTAATTELAAGTLLTLELHRRWWDRAPRTRVLRRLQLQLAEIDRNAGRRTVVAAAITAGARVLVAQRAQPAELAGQWEFPGGKLERGETPQAALVREIAEELGSSIEVGAEISRQVLAAGNTLILFRAALRPDSAEPVALEHRAVYWAAADELAGINWVATNRVFATDVTARL